jgi:phenylacetic acid degradation operon negative regulatory protein
VADYTLRTHAGLPSAAVVALLHTAGVDGPAARIAIRRLSRTGVLESGRDGRDSSCRLTSAAVGNLLAGGAWIAGFATRVDPWDGNWTVAALPSPQHERYPGRALRGQLRWLGYAPLRDGLWVSPDAPNPTVEDWLASIPPDAIAMHRLRHADLATRSNRDPVDAWDVAAIGRSYKTFIQRWEPVLPRIRAGKISRAAAVHARTAIMDYYRHFPIIDPQLPIELMPAGWPRDEARQLFVAVYDGLAEQAQEHVRAVVTRFSGWPSPEIRAHTTVELVGAGQTLTKRGHLIGWCLGERRGREIQPYS